MSGGTMGAGVTIEHGDVVSDAVINGILRNGERIEAMLARGGYVATVIRVRPEWHHDFSRCTVADFEDWTVGYMPAQSIEPFRPHCGQITGCLAGVLDECGAWPSLATEKERR